MTQRELPSSTELAGVNMRLTAGSFRELHWHTADEWAIMLYGNARVTLLNPDGTIFIDDVSKGDLWYFPAGFPHSIQGLLPYPRPTTSASLREKCRENQSVDR